MNQNLHDSQSIKDKEGYIQTLQQELIQSKLEIHRMLQELELA